MRRRLTVVRHGERVDFTFGQQWLETSFDSCGNYIKTSINMPDDVPLREGAPQSFTKDCPLTRVGTLQAQLVGEGLRSQKTLNEDFVVYTSPALRSIQTASSILHGMGITKPLNIESCLFEWNGFCTNFFPKWLTKTELCMAGFNIDPTYIPYFRPSDIDCTEKFEDFYIRTSNFVHEILKHHNRDILLVGHGATLDAATRILTGGCPKTYEEAKSEAGVPYCGVATVEWTSPFTPWRFHVNPFLALKHSAVNPYIKPH